LSKADEKYLSTLAAKAGQEFAPAK